MGSNSPANEPVVALEHAVLKVSRERFHGAEPLLMVRVTDPRERASDADSDSEVGDDAHDEDGVVVILTIHTISRRPTVDSMPWSAHLVVDENENDAENEPCETGRCAS